MRLNLPAKLAFVLLMWVCAFLLDWSVNVVLLLILILAHHLVPAYRPQSTRSRKAFDRFLLYGIAVVVLLAGVNALFLRGGSVVFTVAGVEFHQEGLMFGVRTAARLLLLSVSVLLFFASTPLPEFIHFLQLNGLPPQLVLVLLLTLHFLDQLPVRIHQVFVAQEARGAPVRSGVVSRTKALFSVISPLVLSSIIESIDRGTALEVRGFLHKPASVTARIPAERSFNALTLLFLALSFGVFVFFMVRWLLAF
ncbi:MAG: energy-coupling factor transporter transmembrane component T [Bacteroidota bacterium]